MIERLDYRIIDIGIFLIANLIHLIMIVIFLCRTRKMERIEYFLGLILVSLGLPVLFAVILNISKKRDWWSFILPLILLLFLILEFVLDYILKSNFRNTTLLWPYLLIYYSALMGMIGYSFLVKKTYGFITLFTYFLHLIATWYSYSKVGHG